MRFLRFMKGVDIYFMCVYISVWSCTHAHLYITETQKGVVAVILNILFPPLLLGRFQVQTHSDYLKIKTDARPRVWTVPLLWGCHTLGDSEFCFTALSWIFFPPGFVLEWYLSLPSQFPSFCVGVTGPAQSSVHAHIECRIWLRGEVWL